MCVCNRWTGLGPTRAQADRGLTPNAAFPGYSGSPNPPFDPYLPVAVLGRFGCNRVQDNDFRTSGNLHGNRLSPHLGRAGGCCVEAETVSKHSRRFVYSLSTLARAH
jgi:hypothetical protein